MSNTTMTSTDTDIFCDKINLSDFNQIQSHGGLLVLDNSLRVIQYSENVTRILDTTLDQLLKSPVTLFLESESINENVATWLMQYNDKFKRIDWVSPQNKIKIWLRTNHTPQGIILEIEPHIENDIEDNSLFDLTQQVVDSIKVTTSGQSMQTLIQSTCDEVQKITGYDRVMIYQFDENDHSGVVVGETVAYEMESYLGLHFPATDVPQNVRKMYMDLPIRYIPTIDYQSQKIIPELNPITQTHLDLSSTGLRMVAPVHIKYLANMGMVASASIAIIYNKKLWGLITCHHHKPKYLSVNLRLVMILIGNTLGIQVASLDCSSDYQLEQRTSELLSSLTDKIYKEDSLLYALDNHHQTIMELVGAKGMSVYFQENLTSYGDAPTYDQAMAIIAWIQSENIHSTYKTDTLPLKFPQSSEYKDKACGLLVVPITRSLHHYLIFYRPELVHSIYWAGNPSSTLKCIGDKYSPRDSFERFMQEITNHAAPWSDHDINAAEFIKSTVVNKQLQDFLQIQAMHDPLTGLLNRLYLNQRLEVELNRAKRKSQPLAVILTDIDFFKKINDTFGHQAGDHVLSEFAAFLKDCFRGYDYIYRYGGEEFLILLPDTTLTAAEQKAEKLRHDIKQLVLNFSGTRLPTISISAGIAIFPDNGTDGRSLIAAADIALYKAKTSGRDKIISAVAHQNE